jgi:hypothetical protein
MYSRIAKVFLHGMVLALVPLAVSAGMGSMQEISPQEAEVSKGYATIPDQDFAVIGPGGTTSAARLVLQDGTQLLSCFTQPPEAIAARHGVLVHIALEGEEYDCFEGREPFEQLALEKLLRPSRPMSRDVSASSMRKYRGIDDEEDDDWGPEQQQAVEYRFWEEFAAGGGGGPRCMADCARSLAAVRSICGALPGPAGSLCMLGASALYVACIASC